MSIRNWIIGGTALVAAALPLMARASAAPPPGGRPPEAASPRAKVAPADTCDRDERHREEAAERRHQDRRDGSGTRRSPEAGERDDD